MINCKFEEDVVCLVDDMKSASEERDHPSQSEVINRMNAVRKGTLELRMGIDGRRQGTVV
jgi:hypothetical protein